MSKLDLGTGLQIITIIIMVKDVRLNYTHSASLADLYLCIFIVLRGKNRFPVEVSWTSAVRIFLVSFVQVYLLRMVSTLKNTQIPAK